MEDRSLPTASCKVCGRVTVTGLNNLAKSAKKQSVPFFITETKAVALRYSTATEMEDWGLPTASCKVWDGVTVTELNNLAKSAQKQLVPLTKIDLITLYYSTATEVEDRGLL